MANAVTSITKTTSAPNYYAKFLEFGTLEAAVDKQSWLYNTMIFAHETAVAEDWSAAVKIYAVCVPAAQKFWGPSNIETLEFQRAYANSLTNIGSVTAAADVYQSIQAILEPQLNTATDQTLQQRLRLIFTEIGRAKTALVKRLYKEKKFSEAARISNDNYKLCRRILGETHETTVRAQQDRNVCAKKEIQQTSGPSAVQNGDTINQGKENVRPSNAQTGALGFSRLNIDLRRLSDGSIPSAQTASLAPVSLNTNNVQTNQPRRASHEPPAGQGATPAKSTPQIVLNGNAPVATTVRPTQQMARNTATLNTNASQSSFDPRRRTTGSAPLLQPNRNVDQAVNGKNQAVLLTTPHYNAPNSSRLAGTRQGETLNNNTSASCTSFGQTTAPSPINPVTVPPSSVASLPPRTAIVRPQQMSQTLAATGPSSPSRTYGKITVNDNAQAHLGDKIQHYQFFGPVYMTSDGKFDAAPTKAAEQATQRQRSDTTSIPGSWPVGNDDGGLLQPAARSTIRRTKSDSQTLKGRTPPLNLFGLPSTCATDDWFNKWLPNTHSLFGSGTHLTTAGDRGSRRVRIAILDTGIDPTHPHIKSIWQRIKVNQNFVAQRDNDTDGHGTHLAALINAVAPNANLAIARVFGKRGDNGTEAVVRALNEAVNTWDVDIICMAFGFDKDIPALKQAISAAHNKGVLMFAAATNEGANVSYPMYPARYPEVFCIHATDSFGSMASFNTVSRDGDYSTLGVDVMSVKASCLKATAENSAFHRLSGTSIAAAIAAGTSALILEFAKQPQQDDDEFRYPFEAEEIEQLHTFDGMQRIFDDMQVSDLHSSKFRYIAPWNLLHPNAGRTPKHAQRNIRSKMSYALCKPR